MSFYSRFCHQACCLFHWCFSIFSASEQYDGNQEKSSPSINSQKNSNSSTSGQYINYEPKNAFDGVTPHASKPSQELNQRVSYDVFINHRGCDVKHSLASIIYHTLGLLKIRAFLDIDELELGDSIPERIQEAMRSAKLHIAIFSERYAESPWCLAELSFMVNNGTLIIPVFSNVRPEHLRWVGQGKGIYATAFSQYEEKGRYSIDKLHDWRTALQRVSNMSGYMLNSKTDDQGVLLKQIVEKVLGKLKKEPLQIADTNPVGTFRDHKKGSVTSEVPRWNYVPMTAFGGSGGSPWDDGIYTGIRKIIVRFGIFVDSITIEYDKNGQSVWSERHGGSGGGELGEVEFDYPNEVLESIRCNVYNFNGLKIVTSITFNTNHKKYGPFGTYGGDTFSTTPVGCKIFGLFGRSGQFLDAIGVHSIMEHPCGLSMKEV